MAQLQQLVESSLRIEALLTRQAVTIESMLAEQQHGVQSARQMLAGLGVNMPERGERPMAEPEPPEVRVGTLQHILEEDLRIVAREFAQRDGTVRVVRQ